MPQAKLPALTSPDALDAGKFEDESKRIAELLAAPALDAAERRAAAAAARDIVVKARAETQHTGVMESFLEEFGLSNPEGLALMCLAEALLRVPDADTADALIAEKITSGEWGDHNGKSDSLLVNASTWGLMLTGRIVRPPEDASENPGGFISRMVRQAGEPVIRAAMMQAMRIMGGQFVMGRTIEEALKRGQRNVKKGEAASHSFDMLGEGARTVADARRYFESYANAIGAVGKAKTGSSPETSDGISVKLSALHPAYRAVQGERVHRELYPMIAELAKLAAAQNINFTLDAEEADRLALSLSLLERLCRETDTAKWTGLGLAMQAYQKRSESVVGWLGNLAKDTNRRLMVRLVKGAYWDSEVKRAQIDGQPDYPVFTTKQATDVSYLTCANALLTTGPSIYAQFATHNAHSLASIELMAKRAGRDDYEFQRLHGMGGPLYKAAGRERSVRIYAPVGAHQDLLPYLVRRLLENGANTSFVHSFLDDDVPAERIATDPYTLLSAAPARHPRIPPPPKLYGSARPNSNGLDFSQKYVRDRITAEIGKLDAAGPVAVGSIIAGKVSSVAVEPAKAPADHARTVAKVSIATQADVDAAYTSAVAFQPEWNAMGGPRRAGILEAMADAVERDSDHLIAILAREGGKTLDDCIAEVREAVDFCRYYALDAEQKFRGLEALPGPAGETNALEMMGRGAFACISPWNFPLAIFTGQIAGALAAGNTVLAKPAEQTPLIAFEAVKLFHQAGLPAAALHLVVGDGKVGGWLTGDARCGGVAFTGSTEVARIINRTLAAKDGPIVPLIAETGGLNALFCDTTALREQVVDDVVMSAFRSAGQRCSALRVLFLPHETADDTVEMIKGAMEVQIIGDPADPATDIGPIIDLEARGLLDAHLTRMKATSKIWQRDIGALRDKGAFFGPAIIELDSVDQIDREVFGPVLHIIRYDPDDIEKVGGALSAKGYGLTLGVHSRLEGFAEKVKANVRAGNVYVNRSIIGAVVGVQPFGGSGLSGTGPKAGGPHYVARFATERAVTVNIAAQGGDPTLLNL
ncbi:MAG: bifunctional proline dehydrogenase/L-glutamate gamma-semialdehyde dehydrogenase [Alphaproteobacteria bacterium 32-64-14]|nr:MAG: bifunctional proline dehydrogenase/L-glutamate gamma-semialdehyde dehydrogenase [Alphaproteobacteria bacterium 32-64-14]